MERLGDEMTSEQLVKDFKVLVADAEALLTETANQGGENSLRCVFEQRNLCGS